jgi:hypothetical protein
MAVWKGDTFKEGLLLHLKGSLGRVTHTVTNGKEYILDLVAPTLIYLYRDRDCVL